MPASDDPSPAPTWRLLTPAGVPGAVAIIEIEGDIEGVAARLRVEAPQTGRLIVRDVLGIDQAVWARLTHDRLQIMPHGGVAVVKEILRALDRAGVRERSHGFVVGDYPEASDEIEARALARIAQAASPLAVDLLLDQPRRWRSRMDRDGPLAISAPRTPEQEAHDRRLSRLIDPPLVVALGPANIGKSTLLNTLAGRGVAIVADVPGTTRDHVGVLVELDGLVVRYVDTPGIRDAADEIENAALDATRTLIPKADLLLLTSDALSGPIDLDALVRSAPHAGVLRVALRSDLGKNTQAVDAHISARTGDGLAKLIALIREALVPAADLHDPAEWRFWAD